MAKLHWSCEGNSGVIEISAITTFGRGDDNQLVLPDQKLSRNHGAIEPDGQGGWKAVDRGSSNGLLSGGARKTELPLVNGSEFAAGETKFRFEVPTGRSVETTVLMEPPPPASPEPTPTAAPHEIEAIQKKSGVPHKKLAVAAAVGSVLLGWWVVSNRETKKPGSVQAGLFATEEEKKIAGLETELASTSYASRWSSYKTLKEMGRKPDPAPLWILDLRTHPDDDVREEAAKKLGNARHVPAIAQLRWSHKNDSDWNVRRAAGNALEDMGIKD